MRLVHKKKGRHNKYQLRQNAIGSIRSHFVDGKQMISKMRRNLPQARLRGEDIAVDIQREVDREIYRHDKPFVYYAIQERLVEECQGKDRTLMTDPTDRYHTDWDFGERYGFAEMFYHETSVEKRRQLENVRVMTTVEFNRKHMTSKKGRKGFLLLKRARDMVQSLKDQNESLLYDFSQSKAMFRDEPLYCSRKVDFRVVKITYRPVPRDSHELI